MLYELQKIKFPAHKWRRLANSLKVGSAADDIDADHKDVAGKLQAVVGHWIDNATQHGQWITLVEAVSMCDECRRAKKLATAVGVEYTPSGERMVRMLDVCVAVVYIVMPHAVGGFLQACIQSCCLCLLCLVHNTSHSYTFHSRIASHRIK